jgi:hypothetical protein
MTWGRGRLPRLAAWQPDVPVEAAVRVVERTDPGAVGEVDHRHDLAHHVRPVRRRAVQRPAGVEGRVAGRVGLGRGAGEAVPVDRGLERDLRLVADRGR